MDYYVNSSLRLRLFFDTPNHLAIALVLVWGVGVYLLSFARKRGIDDNMVTLPEMVRGSCLLLLIIALTIGLSVTYSRSGMVAFLVVACALWISRDARRWVAMSLVILAFCLVLMPEAGGRFTSIEPFADKSIAHRFDVWRATLGMSIEKPWTGFGKGNFGETLTVWHLPSTPSHANTRYVSAVNAPLTVLGYWGYPALFGYLCGWALLLIAGFRGLRLGNKAVSVCFLVQLAFLAGGFFTHLHQSKILHVMLLASVSGTVAFHLNEKQAWGLFYRRWLPVAGAGSAAVCGLLAAAGLWLFSEGFALLAFSLPAHGESTGRGWVLAPDRPNGGRLVWFISHGATRENARLLCRPLAKQGWEVVMLEAGAGELLRPGISSALYDSVGVFALPLDNGKRIKITRFVIGGVGEDGLAALALASKISGGIAEIAPPCLHETVVVNIESHWPFVEFNPQNTIKAVGGQVILAYERTSGRYAQAAALLSDMGGKDGRQVDLLQLDVPDGKNILSALRTGYFENKKRN